MRNARAAVETHAVIRTWLWLMTILVLAMIILGGTTRLTDSGLSITEWQPILGVVPPLGEADWVAAFDKYKIIPEFREINSAMSLEEFKFIYWWEWSHRFLGRAIGIVFVVPFVFLLISRRLERRDAARLGMLLALGACQGALGWYMVQSGLVDRVDVSQYRLAAHLLVAAAIFSGLIWTALGIGLPPRRIDSTLALFAGAILILLLLQVGAGALVAGLDAGLSHNTFPLMDGKVVPDGLLVMRPWWKNAFENALAVQFNHRVGAYLVFLCVVSNALVVTLTRQKGAREISAWALVFGVIVQMVLGILTLLNAVPLHLALLHQANAMLLLACAVIHLHLTARRI